jgi:hypothetical protein
MTRVKARQAAAGMTLRAWCRSRGVPPSTLHKALSTGHVLRLPDGTLDPDSADAWLAGRRGSAAGMSDSATKSPNGRPPAGSVAEAQRSWLVCRAMLAQLEYRRRKGELLERVAVQEIAFNSGRALRDDLMRLGERVGPVVAGLGGDIGACIRVIDDEVRRTLDDLAAQRERALGTVPRRRDNSARGET